MSLFDEAVRYLRGLGFQINMQPVAGVASGTRDKVQLPVGGLAYVITGNGENRSLRAQDVIDIAIEKGFKYTHIWSDAIHPAYIFVAGREVDGCRVELGPASAAD